MAARRLLVLNLAMDTNHPALGHSVALTNALAERATHVSVITMTAGELAVAPNVTVHSLGRELGHSEPRRLVEFYRAVGRVIADDPPDAAFAHMAPLFAAMFAPVARMRRIPLVLWYAHSHVSRTLRVAHALSDRCVTSTPAGFRLPSDKLTVIGQGIDTTRFAPPVASADERERTLLSIGRLSPVKRVDEMLEALALVRSKHGLSLRLEIVGSAATPPDERYAASLRRRADELGVADSVGFSPALPYSAIPAAYHRGGVFLNLTPSAMDKTILEAMASGCVPVSRNPGFARIARDAGLDALVPAPGAEALAGTIAHVVSLAPADRAALAASARSIVASEHSLQGLADRILEQLEGPR